MTSLRYEPFEDFKMDGIAKRMNATEDKEERK
jgi:hypothetical protein